MNLPLNDNVAVLRTHGNKYEPGGKISIIESEKSRKWLDNSSVVYLGLIAALNMNFYTPSR